MTHHWEHMFSLHHNHHKNYHDSTKKTTEPLQPIADTPPNND